MRILDKYILKSFIGPFLFGVFAFTTIFVGTGTLFRIAQFITDYGASLWSVTKVFFLAIPSIIVLTFPMSTLLASLMTFGKLSGNSEIIVMRSCGQAFVRLALPIYILAFFISVGTTAFNEFVVPAANHAYQQTIQNEIKRGATPKTQKNIVLKDVTDGHLRTLLYAASFDSEKKELYHITVQLFTETGALDRIENANKAIWVEGYWHMIDGIVYDITEDKKINRSMEFAEQELPLHIAPKKVSSLQLQPDEMTIRQLRTQIELYEVSGASTAELKMVMYSRFSIPFASFVFALIGACLGLQKQRASSSIGFGISALILFFYYGVMTLTQAFGKSGVLTPLLAAFAPNLLTLVVGLYLNYRASK